MNFFYYIMHTRREIFFVHEELPFFFLLVFSAKFDAFIILSFRVGGWYKHSNLFFFRLKNSFRKLKNSCGNAL